MRNLPWLVALAAWTLAGCKDEWFFQGTEDKTPTTGTDAGDADVDTDADSDVDTDADTDTDPSGLDCDADYATPSPGGALGTCVTAEVGCGDVVYGTLEGGSTTYDYDYWLMVGELGSLFGEYTALDGPERVYVFRDGQPDQWVVATFESCFEQWANWVQYGDVSSDFCDTTSYETAGVFETGSGQTWTTERLNPNGAYEYEFILEGLYGATGNYKLTVECL